MSVAVACPRCGKIGNIPDTYEGRSVNCPKCRNKFTATRSGAETINDLAANTLTTKLKLQPSHVGKTTNDWLHCPHCKNPLRNNQELAGKRIKCPKCGVVVGLPDVKSVLPVRNMRWLWILLPTAALFIGVCAALLTLQHVPAVQNELSLNEQKSHLDSYLRIINDLELNQLVSEVSVHNRTATIRVRSDWFFMPYRMRLQHARNLWRIWANISSPKDKDRARIRLVDAHRDEIGGSRAIGGSVIWVED